MFLIKATQNRSKSAMFVQTTPNEGGGWRPCFAEFPGEPEEFGSQEEAVQAISTFETDALGGTITFEVVPAPA